MGRATSLDSAGSFESQHAPTRSVPCAGGGSAAYQGARCVAVTKALPSSRSIGSRFFGWLRFSSR